MRSKAATAVPLPPARPAEFGATPKTQPAPAAPQPQPKTEARRPPPPLPPLPTASRERMHACGAAWQKMKLSGTAADTTWRAFATTCLVQTRPPEDGSP